MDWSATANNVNLSSKCQLLECNMQMAWILEGRQTGRRLGCSRLILLRYVWFDSILREEPILNPEGQNGDAYLQQDTEPRVYLRPLSRRSRAGGPESVTNHTHNGGETERQSGSQIKRAPLWGKRVRAPYKSKQLRRQDGGWNKSRWPHLISRLSERLLLTLKRQNDRENEC